MLRTFFFFFLLLCVRIWCDVVPHARFFQGKQQTAASLLGLQRSTDSENRSHGKRREKEGRKVGGRGRKDRRRKKRESGAA